ncbi:aldehyde dehydrogenase family protein (plasmid) [Priestia megaterium]|uniref:3-sulfolactaldehyde dehydrogenase n=1 Tax=Priestia megaterium (strain ATCC 14581 / DSM 32 / CCUG 1817 / JCM 2506 / NBRC 15308 / NCIMB 9376 / NCTC 10342 / NRRL B-14308 / VKM B-512 / Ford 19) TaxID=1348623 RepID=A0A0B6AHM9_PRIM2|nr:aldehyde dehydrogenase family protein [Priestia megaterium]AJI20113.1 aldehyde dehydrogenase family protein [Priestia megaterium NBRC 15308 = ATCC 14581]KFM94786.1 aldehyde dehydrogenase family protein [Priestia megaterium]KGJ80471.1 aldehyde dehydrogenase [Priestia megaterium NBRC 15308 = ATCC 14581]KNH17345.1 aldehyde dehydrogenase [Priestia megaterium]MDR4231581.1 aldehyde dehydrogenase family protein [Priestia megaterium]
MKIQVAGRKMYFAGKWTGRDQTIEVRDPQDNSIIDTVPAASAEDMLQCIEEAKDGAKIAATMAVHERMAVIYKAADYIEANKEKYASTIAREGSKTIREATKEVARCIQTLRISAEEARRIHGETIPFDQMPGSENRVGYYQQVPIGVIGAITPFNDPLNLVAHKVGPAIASGNAIIVKPATVTPLSALLLAEAFAEAGLPSKVLSVITGYGSEIGDVLVKHPAVRMISFTGGLEAGEEIARKAGLKKISMELGSNSPVIVLEDADLEDAVESTVSGAFWAAGQNCLGVQRIYIQESVIDQFKTAFVERTSQYNMGDKQSELTDMGPLITEKEAIRVEKMVNEAIEKGAMLLTGGKRNKAFYSPTVLTNIPEDCTIAKEEIFGPVVLLYSVLDIDTAIEKSNDVNYGLQAGIFTKNIDKAQKAIAKMDVGGIMVNDSSDYRIDAMPFGGMKKSGLGREGIKFAIHEMTVPKVVCFKLSNY